MVELSSTGSMKMSWASSFMPVLSAISEETVRKKEFSGLRIGLVLHIEAKTAVLAARIQEAGAEVYVAASNPLTTQDDVVSALSTKVTKVWAKRGETEQEYAEAIRNVLASKPDFLIDDGADCIVQSHLLGVSSIKGASEETTTGVNRVRALAGQGKLRYPVVALNDAFTKHLFDNRYGTGQSALDGLMRSTNLLIAGRQVVVAGYGWVGRGVAQRLRGLGARVTVTETDPVRAIEAYMEGYTVLPMQEAIVDADILVTTTGNTKVVTEEHFEKAKNGLILANAGHFNVEVDVVHLEKFSSAKREVRPNVTEYSYKGKKLYLISEGRLVNIAAADGHPVDVMDMSFSGQFAALRYLVNNWSKMKPDIATLPLDVDLEIAKTFLRAHGVKIDALTEEQKKYISSF
ncbi:MAG: adenosylhomocysteinase [Thermoprotei archaeon]